MIDNPYIAATDDSLTVYEDRNKNFGTAIGCAVLTLVGIAAIVFRNSLNLPFKIMAIVYIATPILAIFAAMALRDWKNPKPVFRLDAAGFQKRTDPVIAWELIDEFTTTTWNGGTYMGVQVGNIEALAATVPTAKATEYRNGVNAFGVPIVVAADSLPVPLTTLMPVITEYRERFDNGIVT